MKENGKNTFNTILLYLGVILIAGGILLAAYPSLERLYYQRIVWGDDTKLSVTERWAKGEGELGFVMEISESAKTLPERFPDKLEPGDGVLEIPNLSLKIAVTYGVEDQDLKNGPGFYPQSEYPDVGNVAIAGHRNVHGSPFRNLDKLKKGDQIMLYYGQKQYIYEVEQVYITHSRDWSVIDPTQGPALTLTTCDPVIRPSDGNYDRLIVRAYIVDIMKNWS